MKEIELQPQSEIFSENSGNFLTIGQLVTTPEFKQAWEAEFTSRSSSFYRERGNKKAADIVRKILECQDLYNLEVPKGLASIAKKNKSKDLNWSLFSSIIRISFAAGIILINHYYDEEHEDKAIFPALKYSPILAQLLLTLKTSFHGYQSLITRNLSEELTDSFCKVLDDFTMESEKLNPDPNFSSPKDKTTNSRCSRFFPVKLPIEFGAALHVFSLELNFAGGMIENYHDDIRSIIKKFSEFDQTASSYLEIALDKSAGSYLKVASGIISSLGKTSSVIGASYNLKIVEDRMQKAANGFNSKKITINQNQAKEILSGLSSNYKKNTHRGLLSNIRRVGNYIGDFFYGMSYGTYNWITDYIVSSESYSTMNSNLDEVVAGPDQATSSSSSNFSSQDQATSSNSNFSSQDQATSSNSNFSSQDPSKHSEQHKNQPSNIFKPEKVDLVLGRKHDSKSNQIP